MPVSLSKVPILFFILRLIEKKCRLTSTTDNCCQRAKVHRWVTQPGLFVIRHDHVAVNFFSGTCIIFSAKCFYIFLRHLCYFFEISIQFLHVPYFLFWMQTSTYFLFLKQCPIFGFITLIRFYFNFWMWKHYFLIMF
jgi:hypothetical protein